MKDIPLCSGYGPYHTDKKSPLIGVTFEHIQNLVDSPQQVSKENSLWAIPSSLFTRDSNKQSIDGSYYFLWADIDESHYSINELANIVGTLDCCFELYTTKSSIIEKPRFRILIPLPYPITMVNWVLSQKCLSTFLQTHSIITDKCAERPTQLCYLPNRGEHYDSISERAKALFDINIWQGQMVHFQEEEKRREQTSIQRMHEKTQLRQASSYAQETSLIDQFDKDYPVEKILLMKNYEQLGADKFRHPASESGSFSARVLDGRVHSLSNADPLFSEEGAHDSFSAFTVLFHNGDIDRALKDAGDHWVFVNGQSWNEAHRSNQATLDSNHNNCVKHNIGDNSEDCVVDLSKFSICPDIDEMKTQLKNDIYVLSGMAILGQGTVFYAAPNTGKTLIVLKLLAESISDGNIKGEDVYYVNADDNLSGLTIKGEIAKANGFHMLAPGYKGFEAHQLLSLLDQLCESGQAKGKIIVLDTLKKFTDLMDKKVSSNFGNKTRKFVALGGTLIALAHTNKHRNSDGEPVFEGTADIVADVDCVYILDLRSDENDNGVIERCITFKNFKSRGDVLSEVTYKYQKVPGHGYNDLFHSVRKVDNDEVKRIAEERAISLLLLGNEEAIGAITSTIESGITKTEAVINHANNESDISKQTLRKVLRIHSGEDYSKGHRWKRVRGDKNTYHYHLLINF
ncbi:hypothetical protein [Thalassotalea maritima]|uniref:hypothetical protein n=1 Tax=Thalassotalea maritima TaxID=3242416 RepID=UPI00352804B5